MAILDNGPALKNAPSQVCHLKCSVKPCGHQYRIVTCCIEAAKGAIADMAILDNGPALKNAPSQVCHLKCSVRQDVGLSMCRVQTCTEESSNRQACNSKPDPNKRELKAHSVILRLNPK